MLAFSDPWVMHYAQSVCSEMNFNGLKVKGRGHDERRLYNPGNEWHGLLPAVYIAMRDTNQYPPIDVRRRFYMVKHYRHLDYCMIAAGLDIERGEVVCQDAAAFALAVWRLTGFAMPAHLSERQWRLVCAKVEARDRAEDSALLARIAS